MRYLVLVLMCCILPNAFGMQRKVQMDFRVSVQNKSEQFFQCLVKIGIFIASVEEYSQNIYQDSSQYSIGYGDGFLAREVLAKKQKKLPNGINGRIIAIDSMLNSIERIIFKEIPYLERIAKTRLYNTCNELIALTSRLYQQGLPEFQKKSLVAMFAKHYNNCSIAKAWIKEMPHKKRATCEVGYFVKGTKCNLPNYDAICKNV